MSWRTMWQRWLTWLNPWLGLRTIVPMSGSGGPVPPIKPTSSPYPLTPEPPPVVSSPARLPVPVERAAFVPGPNTCEVCGVTLSHGTARTFDGHWRCVPHKAVTCDVCVRDLPPSTLTDVPWMCARHG